LDASTTPNQTQTTQYVSEGLALGPLAAPARLDLFDVQGADEYLATMDANRQQIAQRLGRRIGIAAFAGLMALFVAVCSVQILYQGFHSVKVETQASCRAAIYQFIGEIRNARAAAAVEVQGERAAMARFRSALSLEKTTQKSIEQQCRTDTWGKHALEAVDEWRWAEENAVRYESVDLAPSRRRIQAIEIQLGHQAPNQ